MFVKNGETIQGGTLIKGGYQLRKYGNCYLIYTSCKGQEISEGNCAVFDCSKNNENIYLLSALESKIWLNEQTKSNQNVSL